MLKIGVLDAGLHDIEGRGDGDGRDGTRDGCDEVLAPGGFGVVLQAEYVLLGRRRGTEELEGENRVNEMDAFGS